MVTGIHTQIIDFQKIQNYELASLWDANDYAKVQRHFQVMESYSRSIKVARALGNWGLFNKLRDEKAKKEEIFDEKLMKYYNDQKSSLSFNDNGIRDFEPFQVTPQKNTVLLKGLSIMLSYFAFETNSTVQGYSIGIGTDEVFPFQENLVEEKERVAITEGGKSATGNYLRYSVQYSPSLETNTYSEFGLEMFLNSPPAVARTVISEFSKRLRHEQGNTFIMGSHYLVFVPQVS